MTRKHIIFVHGRSTKPSASAKRRLSLDALLHGLDKVSPAAATKLRDRSVRFSFTYYGDINNAIMAQHDAREAARMTARNDKRYDHEPCLPYDDLASSLKRLKSIPDYDQAAYEHVTSTYKDHRYLDNAARAFSTLLATLTRSRANEIILKRSSADMGAYLLSRKTGSDIRERVQGPLRRAINRREEICLISHSMGCIVAYDVLWKFSQMSEYAPLMRRNPNISMWLTLGSPLGEAGVRANLYDAREHAGGRFPRSIVRDWVNIAAYDDFIAHDPHMANDFAEMLDYGYVNSITDRRMYNCWVHHGVSNPHKLYGYLVNEIVAEEIARWIER
jgi:hypothetical protein